MGLIRSFMALYRPFFVGFWTDPDIEPFKPLEKLIYSFLFTNDRTTESGIYTISKKHISERTGVSISETAEIMKNLESVYKKITRDGISIFVHGFLRRNSRGNPDMVDILILKDLDNTPSLLCWKKFIEVYKNHRICNKIKEKIKSLSSVGDTSIGIEIGIEIDKRGSGGEKKRNSFKMPEVAL